MSDPRPAAAAGSARVRGDLVAVIGCTGTGKSKLAVELAQHVQSLAARQAPSIAGGASRYAAAEVVSADSMQVYEGMDVITNKATEAEMAGVRHHLMSFLPASAEFTIKDFTSHARTLISDMHRSAPPVLPIIAGGTSYYVQHLLFPGRLVSDETEDRREERVQVLSAQASETASQLPTQLQTSWSQFTQAAGIQDAAGGGDDLLSSHELWDLLHALDPVMAARWHPNDQRKILRSLTVFATTGRRHSDWLEAQEKERAGQSMAAVEPEEDGEQGGNVAQMRRLIFWVWCEPEILKARLDQRIHKMIENGLLSEISELRRIAREIFSKEESYDYTRGIFQTIGFKEFEAFLDKADEQERTTPGPPPASSTLSGEAKALFETAVENMQRATRQYARRQTSWIRNQLLAEIKTAREEALQRSRLSTGAGAGADVEVYLLDASDLSQWDERVATPAKDIFERFLAHDRLPEPLRLNSAAAEHLAKVYARDESSHTSQSKTTASTSLGDKAFVPCPVCSPSGQPAFLVRVSELRQHEASRRHRMAVKKATKREYEARRRAEAAERRGLSESVSPSVEPAESCDSSETEAGDRGTRPEDDPSPLHR